MSPKIINKDSKKMEILRAAMRVFAQKGVANTKMIDIAESASIGKGTIYEYFTNKEEIFALAFQYFFQDIQVKIENALQQTEDVVTKLKVVIELSLYEFLESSGDLAGIIMDFWAEGIRNKDHKILDIINLKQIYQEYRQLISAIIQEGIDKGIFQKTDPLALAAVLIAAFDGLFLQWIMEPSIINLHRVADILLDSILNGIIKRKCL